MVSCAKTFQGFIKAMRQIGNGKKIAKEHQPTTGPGYDTSTNSRLTYSVFPRTKGQCHVLAVQVPGNEV